MIKAIGLYSQKLYQNQRVLRRSIYIEPNFTSREECNAFADLFLEFIHDFRFCQPACFLQLDLHWDSPKLPWGIQRTCEPFVLKTIIIMPVKRIFVPWHSLIRSLYFIQVHIFIYTSDTFRPILALFTQFTLHQFFLMYITTRNIFFLSPMTLLLGI